MTEGRVYPVRNPEVVAQEQRDYRTKIETNKDAGRNAFATGEYQPFLGWKEAVVNNQFWVALELTPHSQEEVIERVVNPLQNLAQEYAIPAIFAGKGDLPPHVSLQVGILKDIPPEQTKVIQQYLASNKSHLNLLAQILEGLTFHMDTLVMAPNSYICASKFDDEQGVSFRTRKAVERIMSKALGRLAGQTDQPIIGSFAPPYSYYDIFHTSVLRLVDEASSERLLPFTDQAYARVGQDLKQNPIPITVQNLYRGTPTEYIHTHTPNLLLS